MSHKPVYTGIIPARYNSTRFPGKPVYPIAGIPMVVRVYRNCKKSTLLDELFVATDDRRIYNTVLEYGGRAIMTKKSHASGTDRLKEASEKVRGDYFINIQGDEPLINPGLLTSLVKYSKGRGTGIFTAVTKIRDRSDYFDTNIVKTVLRKDGRALYFSRSPVPAFRGEFPLLAIYRHLGIYLFSRKVLTEYSSLRPSGLEKAECLEQLRWMENGGEIFCLKTSYSPLNVDVEKDVLKIERILYSHG